MHNLRYLAETGTREFRMRTGQALSHTSREDVENGVGRIPKRDGIRTFYYFLTLVQNVDQGGCAGILGVIDFSIETNAKKRRGP